MRRLAAVLALALAACGRGDAPPGVVVRDSAGVTVVENGPAALASAAAWSLASEPSLDVRSSDADGILLFNVTDLLPLAGGGLAVANGGSKEVLVFGPHGALPELAVFPGGAGMVLFGAVTVAATAGDDLVVGLGESPEVRYHAPDGRLTRIVRWADHDRLVPPERIERFLDAMLAEVPEGQHPAMRAFFEQAPKAERVPPYEDLIGSSTGDLWVGGYVGPERLTPDFREPEREWFALDPDGALGARLASPAGFSVRAFTDSAAYGVFTDELGVESVRAYPIERGTGP